MKMNDLAIFLFSTFASYVLQNKDRYKNVIPPVLSSFQLTKVKWKMNDLAIFSLS
jgi:hypothetical protein